MPLDHDPVLRWGALLLLLVMASTAWPWGASCGLLEPLAAILGYLGHLLAIYLTARRLGRALRQG